MISLVATESTYVWWVWSWVYGCGTIRCWPWAVGDGGVADMKTIRKFRNSEQRTSWGTLIDAGEWEILHGSDRSITKFNFVFFSSHSALWCWVTSTCHRFHPRVNRWVTSRCCTKIFPVGDGTRRQWLVIFRRVPRPSDTRGHPCALLVPRGRPAP
jgi:hypothetical protein